MQPKTVKVLARRLGMALEAAVTHPADASLQRHAATCLAALAPTAGSEGAMAGVVEALHSSMATAEAVVVALKQLHGAIAIDGSNAFRDALAKTGAFAQTLDALGARMGGGVTIDSAMVSISGLSQHLWRFIELATGVALTPALPEIAVAAERHKAMQIHRHEWATIEGLTNLWLMNGLYGTHPYGLPRTTLAGLKATRREDHNEHCCQATERKGFRRWWRRRGRRQRWRGGRRRRRSRSLWRRGRQQRWRGRRAWWSPSWRQARRRWW